MAIIKDYKPLEFICLLYLHTHTHTHYPPVLRPILFWFISDGAHDYDAHYDVDNDDNEDDPDVFIEKT